jgi:predicted restriction endonuclease
MDVNQYAVARAQDKSHQIISRKAAERYLKNPARKIMDRSKIEKKCRLCGYSETVQVAHLKKISIYSEDTPIGVVNDLSNLIYLCPNEHILYDKGKLSISP